MTTPLIPPFPTASSGYGFVDFENPLDAQKAVQALQAQGVVVQFARLPTVSFLSL